MKRIILKLVIILIMIELILRATGWIYYFSATYKPPNDGNKKIKILCLGESTTFGVGAAKGDDYPSQLNGLLEKRYPNKFLVYNRGIPGITSSGILFRVGRLMEIIEPNLVILLCGANELNPTLNYNYTYTIVKTRIPFVNDFIFKVSRFLRHLKTYKTVLLIAESIEYLDDMRAIKSKPGSFKEFDENIQILIRYQYNDNINKITEFIRRQGAVLVYSTYLSPGNFANQWIKDAAYNNSAILCNQREMLQNAGTSLTTLVSKDGFHPNAAGYKIMAENLYRCIQENKLINLETFIIDSYNKRKIAIGF